MAEMAKWESDSPTPDDKIVIEQTLSVEDQTFFLDLPGGHRILNLDPEEAAVVRLNLRSTGSVDTDWA